ncbi:MAG: hypothetical protein Q7S66_04350 [bacterium]|nr:hypothetical protein [bacterium]
MSSFEQAKSLESRRRTAEAAEVGIEATEKATEAAEKKMGARERVETISKEVQNTNQQIQNIMANMQQVVKVVQAIRRELGLADGSIPSVARDEEALKILKRKLAGLFSELDDLKLALQEEEARAVRSEHPDWGTAEVEVEAAARTERLMGELV